MSKDKQSGFNRSLEGKQEWPPRSINVNLWEECCMMVGNPSAPLLIHIDEPDSTLKPPGQDITTNHKPLEGPI